MKYLFVFCLILNFAQAEEQKKRPNIILLLADNWAWPHASAYGNKALKTPNFDAIAKSGTLFTHGFCQVPSCSPARAVLLSGRPMHQLGEAANLWGNFPADLKVFPQLLQNHGYNTGWCTKGWGPGLYHDKHYRQSNPCGKRFPSVQKFLTQHQKENPEKPFFFWYGSHEPHLPWNHKSTEGTVDINKIKIPSYLPNIPEVKNDIANYFNEVQSFDQQIGKIIETLKQKNMLENTVLVVMGDNGWQMPRGLAQVYDAGTRVSMAISWPGHFKKAQTATDFVSFEDFAPTFLELAGVKTKISETGKSLLPLLQNGNMSHRSHIFLERERHANVRSGDSSYPVRAVRNKKHLFVINYFPDRWPGGDPKQHFAVGPFGDVDNSQTKTYITANQSSVFFKLAFAKRPEYELYDIVKDPDQMNNLADREEFAGTCNEYKAMILQWMKDSKDPLLNDKDHFSKFSYFGGPPKKAKKL